MAGTLAEFTTQIKTRNVSRPTLFYVQFTAPPGGRTGISGPDSSTDQILPFFCHNATTPGYAFATNDNYSTAGIKRKFIYDHDHQNLRLDFYVDQNYEIKKYFDKWKNLILPEKRNFAFPDQYTSDKLDVFILNLQDKEVYQYSYLRVFPKTISEIQLSWQNSIAISTFSVEFVFEEVSFTQKSNSSTNIQDTSSLTSLLPITPASVSQIANNEILNILSSSFNADPSVQLLIDSFGGGVGGAILP